MANPTEGVSTEPGFRVPEPGSYRSEEVLRSMRKLLVLVLVAVAVSGSIGVASADPNLPDIRPHRHFIETDAGKTVEVGPRVCDNPALQDAFNQFHSNLHRAVPGSTGPAESAPGLHNGFGGEITATGC